MNIWSMLYSITLLFSVVIPGWCDGADVVNDTHYFMQRSTIHRKEWISATPKIEDGELFVFGEVVMSDMEDNYMNALVDQLMRSSIASVPKEVLSDPKRVLEIGFGMGISAGYISDHVVIENLLSRGHAVQHVVVEPNRDIFLSCLSKAANRTKSSGYTLSPMFSFWEDVLPLMQDSSFDGILFDPFPSTLTLGFMKQAHRLLKQGGVLTFYLRQLGDSASHFWDLTQNELITTGFDPFKISVDFMPTKFKSDCGDIYRRCPNSTITFVIPRVEK